MLTPLNLVELCYLTPTNSASQERKLSPLHTDKNQGKSANSIRDLYISRQKFHIFWTSSVCLLGVNWRLLLRVGVSQKIWQLEKTVTTIFYITTASLQQQGIWTVFKSDTTRRSPSGTQGCCKSDEQEWVVYKIPCKCFKVCIELLQYSACSAPAANNKLTLKSWPFNYLHNTKFGDI